MKFTWPVANGRCAGGLLQAAVERSRALLTEKRVAGVRLEEELAALREDEVDIALAIRQKQGANAALQVRGVASRLRARLVSTAHVSLHMQASFALRAGCVKIASAMLE